MLEDPTIMGSSRLHVVRRVVASHREAYEEAFGSLPAILKHLDFPPHGLPAIEEVKLPIEISSYGLATLSGKGLLLDILTESQKKRLAPATELSRRVLDFPTPDGTWVKAYKDLDDEVKEAIDHAFIRVGQAFAAYQRHIVSAPSKFDRFAERLVAGDTVERAMEATSFSETELTGLKLFVGPGGCLHCHSGPGFSDQKFHNIGLPSKDGAVPMGRAVGALLALGDPFNCFSHAFPDVNFPTNDDTDRCPTLSSIDVSDVRQVGAFKTPSLRNVAMTAPYMHDGRFPNLEKVLEFYSHFEGGPATGERDPVLTPLRLSPEEVEALSAYLGALTSPLLDLGVASNLSHLDGD
jgi:cytochrome c peroxidase